MSDAPSQPLSRPPSVPLWEDVQAMLALVSQHKDTRYEPDPRHRSYRSQCRLTRARE